MTFGLSVTVDVDGRLAVVVGGGRAGMVKVEGLLAAGARVTVVEPRPSDVLGALEDAGEVMLVRRGYRPGDLAGAFLAVAATGRTDVDQRVLEEARSGRVLAMSASDPQAGDFVTNAIVRRGKLSLAVSTGGATPALARYLRKRLERDYGPEWEVVVELVEEVRRLVPSFDGVHERDRLWRRVITSDLLALVRAGRVDDAKDHVHRVLTGSSAVGFVSLVGAGPGAPELITVKGKERIGSADVVAYDRLADPSLLEFAPPDAERIYIGKAYGKHTVEQNELNALLVALARQGKRVVRLKGGDPFVFGRGGEEAEALARAGIPFEIVPGVTSAVAVPAYAGIPVTDRRFGSSVAFVTGHKHPQDPDNRVDYSGIASSVDTLVVLMGARWLSEITEELIDAGRLPGTPAAAIEWGTHPHQRTVTSSLAELHLCVSEAGLGSPMVVVIGEVVSMRSSLSWFESASRQLLAVPQIE